MKLLKRLNNPSVVIRLLGIALLFSGTVFQSSLAEHQVGRMKSTVGIELKVITHDGSGHVWVGGSVWLLQGLLIQIDGTEPKAKVLSDVSTIQDLGFTGRLTGWMIGDYHSLYLTRDGGNTWQKSLDGESNFNSACFIDAVNGWVVGDHGLIYRTNDAGKSWHRQNSATDYKLEKVIFVDGAHGWAIGGGSEGSDREWTSILIASSDGGTTWKRLTCPPLLRSIFFVDKTSGWGLDLNSNILHTTDGGESWSIQYIGRRTHLYSLSFLNKLQGWAVGDRILRTEDGGITWLSCKFPKSINKLEKIVFVAPLNAWAVGLDNQALLFNTTDGGKSWNPVSDQWKEEIVEQVYRSKFQNR